MWRRGLLIITILLSLNCSCSCTVNKPVISEVEQILNLGSLRMLQLKLKYRQKETQSIRLLAVETHIVLDRAAAAPALQKSSSGQRILHHGNVFLCLEETAKK